MELKSCYLEYLNVNLNIQSYSTKNHYQGTLKDLVGILGREPELSDLSDEFQSMYARKLIDRDLSPYTINQRLDCVRALWRHACRRGYIQTWPTSINVPEPREVPCAWSQDELDKLWNACDTYEGTFLCGPAKGISRAQFWKCFHLICYWTGERTGAVRCIEWAWLNGSCLSIPARFRKGRRQARKYWLPDETLAEIEKLRKPERDRVFPVSQASFYQILHRFQKHAGLDGHRVGPQKMRRTHASLVARHGGDPVKALGHSDARVTTQFYLDPTVAESQAYNQVLPQPVKNP